MVLRDLKRRNVHSLLREVLFDRLNLLICERRRVHCGPLRALQDHVREAFLTRKPDIGLRVLPQDAETRFPFYGPVALLRLRNCRQEGSRQCASCDHNLRISASEGP